VQTAEQLLRELEASVLFEPDFPKRLHYSYEQWQASPQQAARASQRPQLEANERTRSSCKHLEDVVRRLGIARYQPAIPTLADLWRECALVPVRIAAGHALLAMQAEEARAPSSP